MAYHDPDRLQQIHWNNNLAYLMQMDELMRKRNEASIVGDFMTWFRANVQLYALLKPVLKQEGDTKTDNELNGLLKKIKVHLSRSFTNTPIQQQLVNMKHRFHEAEENLTEFDILANVAMFKHEIVKLRPKLKTTEDILDYDNKREQ